MRSTQDILSDIQKLLNEGFEIRKGEMLVAKLTCGSEKKFMLYNSRDRGVPKFEDVKPPNHTIHARINVPDGRMDAIMALAKIIPAGYLVHTLLILQKIPGIQTFKTSSLCLLAMQVGELTGFSTDDPKGLKFLEEQVREAIRINAKLDKDEIKFEDEADFYNHVMREKKPVAKRNRVMRKKKPVAKRNPLNGD